VRKRADVPGRRHQGASIQLDEVSLAEATAFDAHPVGAPVGDGIWFRFEVDRVSVNVDESYGEGLAGDFPTVGKGFLRAFRELVNLDGDV